MNDLQRLAQRIARLQVEFMHAKRAAIGTGRVKVVAVKATMVTMKIDCPRCSCATPSYRTHCIHCNAELSPRPLFDPDDATPKESWEKRLQMALIAVFFMLLWIVAYFGPWNH